MLKIILRILAPFCWPGRKIKTASENHHGHNETQTNFEANDHILQIGKDMSESTRAALDVEFRNISSQEVQTDVNQRFITALNNLKTNMFKSKTAEVRDTTQLQREKLCVCLSLITLCLS